MSRLSSKTFATLASWLSKWLGSHWAFLIAAVLVAVALVVFGLEKTNIAISITTLLMVFVLQNSQHRDSAALHVKLDEVITHLDGPRNELVGIEAKPHEEIEELHEGLGSATRQSSTNTP